MKNILLLGASGTVGSAIFKQLSFEEDINIIGTYYSNRRGKNLLHDTLFFGGFG